MALPSSTSVRQVRHPEEESQTIRQQHQSGPGADVPRITTRAAGDVATMATTGLDEAMAHVFRPNSPIHFSVPDPARGHLIKLGEMVASLEDATSTQIVRLLNLILLQCNQSNRNEAYASVCHLLSRGVEVNLIESDSAMMNPLSTAVAGSFIHVRIVAALLRAGANPWLTFNRPDYLPLNSEFFSITDFYKQAGMDINAEATVIGFASGKLSALGMAYVAVQAKSIDQLVEAGAYVGDVMALKRNYTEQQVLEEFGPTTLDAIASYRAQRAYQPCSFVPYMLLHDALQPNWPAATDIGDTRIATTTSTTTYIPASGAALAQAALKPACNALIDGLYSTAAVIRLIGCVHNMPPAFIQAVVQALSLARVLGHYSAGHGARASQVDQGIRLALASAGLWEKYLDCKAQFETLQNNIDRHQADGRTLLTMAATNGKIRMIRLLVKLGARINFPDVHGGYPLTAAAKARKPDTCSALLSLGANAGTSDLQKRSTLFHVADWLTQTDISDTATVGRIAGLVEQLLRLGYDFRQPMPEDHAGHAAYPTVADLLCAPENCVKLALLGPQRTQALTQAFLFNIDRRGALPCLTDRH